jgi:hypothetical protein
MAWFSGLHQKHGFPMVERFMVRDACMLCIKLKCGCAMVSMDAKNYGVPV